MEDQKAEDVVRSEGELDYSVYLSERKLLIDAEREGARSFDKAILSLGAGAFALSLTFVGVVPGFSEGTEWLLFVSYVFCGISMCCTLVSFLTSQRACREHVALLEDMIEEENREHRKKKRRQAATAKRWGRATVGLNIAAIAAFAVGAAALAFFAGKNLRPHGKESLDGPRERRATGQGIRTTPTSETNARGSPAP